MSRKNFLPIPNPTCRNSLFKRAGAGIAMACLTLWAVSDARARAPGGIEAGGAFQPGDDGHPVRTARNEGAGGNDGTAQGSDPSGARGRLLDELARIREQTGESDAPAPLDPPLPVRRKPSQPGSPEQPAGAGGKPVSAAVERLTGQMLLIEFSGTSPNEPEAKAVHALLQRGAVAGVVLTAENLVSKAQAKELIKFLALAGQSTPVLIAARETGGAATAFTLEKGFEPWPSQADVSSRANPEYAYSTYKTLASNLAYLGFNLNFGPWLGMVAPSLKPGDSFSADPRQAAVFAKTFVLGHKEASVIAVPVIEAGDGPSRSLSYLLAPYPDISIAVAASSGGSADYLLQNNRNVRGARFCFLAKKDLAEAALRLDRGCDVLVAPGGGEPSAARDRVLRSIADAVEAGGLTLQQLSAAAARINVLRAGIGRGGDSAIPKDTTIQPVTGKVDIDD